jgi:SAM-dependent methyltransferase
MRHSERLSALGVNRSISADENESFKLQLKQQQHFDWYAHNTTQSYSEYEQTPFWSAVDQLTFEPWRKEITSGSWLLDIGSAQGRSTLKLLDLDINIIGFDVSKNLVRQAIQRYRSRAHRARAFFFAADGSALLPFVDEAFDYVLVYGVLHHLPDPGLTCREITRVLKPGGIYFGSENNRTVFRAAFDLLHKLSPIWHEEAGPQPLISNADLHDWFRSTVMSIDTKTSVFLPPHLINHLPRPFGYCLLRSADRIAQSIPGIRPNGGLILIHGNKRRHS